MHMQESKCYERAKESTQDQENLDALSQIEGFFFCVREIAKTITKD